MLTIKNLCRVLPLILLSLIITPIGFVQAQTQQTFYSVGVDIDLSFEEEAHPQTEIIHNIKIIAKSDLTINQFSINIYALVNQSLEQIPGLPTINSLPMIEDQVLPIRINFTTPPETKGRLYCNIYLSTSKSSDHFSASIYTTNINSPTFAELLADYSSLLSEYNTLSTQLSQLQAQYTSLSNSYQDLEEENQKIRNEYIAKENEYQILNSTHTQLQSNYASLDSDYTSLKRDYDDLYQEKSDLENEIENIASSLNSDKYLMIIFIIIIVALVGLIIYLRNKQKEPYVVIRKETVSMKPEKKK